MSPPDNLDPVVVFVAAPLVLLVAIAFAMRWWRGIILYQEAKRVLGDGTIGLLSAGEEVTKNALPGRLLHHVVATSKDGGDPAFLAVLRLAWWADFTFTMALFGASLLVRAALHRLAGSPIWGLSGAPARALSALAVVSCVLVVGGVWMERAALRSYARRVDNGVSRVRWVEALQRGDIGEEERRRLLAASRLISQGLALLKFAAYVPFLVEFAVGFARSHGII